MLNKFKKIYNEKKEVYLRVKVSPGVSKSAVKQILDDETIKIDIAAQPEKGKANQELIKFLAREFEVDKTMVKIISGASDRIKLIKIK